MEGKMDEKLIPKIKDLDELVKELHVVFSHDKVNIDDVKALLSAYTSNPKDWKKYARFDTHRYTRNLIDTGNGKFNLMALCWGEGQGSSIHSHSDAHCFVKVLDGQLQETMFAWPSDSEEEAPMTRGSASLYGKDGVTYIDDTIGLHRMENLSHTDRAITMHLYSPPYDSCQIFDERTGHSRKAMVTFWSQYGERTPHSAESNECAGPCNILVAEPEDN